MEEIDMTADAAPELREGGTLRDQRRSSDPTAAWVLSATIFHHGSVFHGGALKKRILSSSASGEEREHLVLILDALLGRRSMTWIAWASTISARSMS